MTIKDIARESGYAVGTVSRVLNNQPNVSEKAREQIMRIVNAYGFTLNSNAKQLRQSSSAEIAVLVKGTSNSLFALLVEEIQAQASRSGYNTSVFYFDEDEDEVIEALRISREQKPPALMLLGANARHFVGRFDAIKIPTVVLTNDLHELEFCNLSSIGINDDEAAGSAIDFLIGCGHSRIGIIGGNRQVSDISLKRFNGCMASFARHGIEFDWKRQYEQTRFAFDSAYRGMCRLLSKMPELTAVFAMSDTMAIGASSALRDSGKRIPEDVSIVGFDGLPIADFYNPRLSTVRQPADAIAARSVRIIVEGIETGVVSHHEFLPYEVVQGQSVRVL